MFGFIFFQFCQIYFSCANSDVYCNFNNNKLLLWVSWMQLPPVLRAVSNTLVIWLIVARRLPGDHYDTAGGKRSRDLQVILYIKCLFFFTLLMVQFFKYSLHICNTLHLQKYFLGFRQKLLIQNVLSVELSVHNVCSYPQEGTV